ncbi:MAG: hypothetical protein GQ542_03715 [Desulforhopalus sp.]|nr:hypothetical protein [Desulforhopalus sp.]
MTSNEPIPFRPLGILKTILETIGCEVTHCYEDLVFVEHNAFLLRMEAKGEEVSLLFNTESDVDKRDEIEELLNNAGKTHNLVISCSGTYQMTPNETDVTINIEFKA